MPSALPNPKPKLHDTVVLKADVPAEGLKVGEIGTVVDLRSPDDFLVEFADDQGRMYALATLKGDQLILVHRRRSDVA
jgi:hypothetical protein